MHPYFIIRAIGWLLFIVGSLIMCYNLWRTILGHHAGEKSPENIDNAIAAHALGE